MKIINQGKGTVLAENAALADTLVSRMKGLLGKTSLHQGEGLVIAACTSIHTFFMKFSIDAVFTTRQGRVIKVLHDLQPWRLSGIYLGAYYCIELPSGTARQTRTETGDVITFQ
ncbi:MAG: DUF192 domain-containing protein [Candidatus Omnitrophica bacterium]|nr:DUF192 domain-containing protein [Candidatus Omnitrophota bacterium]